LQVTAAHLVVSLYKISNPPVVVGIGIIRLQADGFVIILNGTLLLAKVSVSNPPVSVGIG